MGKQKKNQKPNKNVSYEKTIQPLKFNNLKQKRDRYEMHKYWGKKPSNNLKSLIEQYSEQGDTVLDPFSGYGVFCCEDAFNTKH